MREDAGLAALPHLRGAAEERAREEEFLTLAAVGREEAFFHALASAEQWLKAVEEAATQDEKSNRRRKLKSAIDYAEKLKAGGGGPTPISWGQRSDLDRGKPPSTTWLSGGRFDLWTKDPDASSFGLSDGEPLYTDKTDFTLSERQLSVFAGWARPQSIPQPAGEKSPGNGAPTEYWGECCDLIQDVTADCSVVASLCAASKLMSMGPNPLLKHIFFPFDNAECRPALSPNGKYIFRMYFNGGHRRVVIDDLLPSSKTGRYLHATDREHPQLLWPALVEKAYLKIRGGYDFPGSNSGTDLHVITGWIPEQIFLQSEDLDVGEVWDRITSEYIRGNIIITLGTGKIGSHEEEALGLVGEHDYAVLDIRCVSGSRVLQVKNPWCDGASWKGAQPHVGGAATREGSPGVFWVSLEDVAQNFESMYLNWNPSLFPSCERRHFAWKPPPALMSQTLAFNRQFVLCSDTSGTVCILLSKHFTDGELEIARKRSTSLSEVSRQLGFIGLTVFDNGGRRVNGGLKPHSSSPLVDAPQTLLRLVVAPGRRYTVAVAQHGLPLPEYNFSLSVFSQDKLQELVEARDDMAHYVTRIDSWTRRTAGGSATSVLYGNNPQYSIRLDRATPLSIMLSTDSADIAVRVELAWGSSGERITSLGMKDLVAHSGDYSHGCAFLEALVDPGSYTVIPSTFEPGQRARFALRVGSQMPLSMEKVPENDAGRRRTALSPLVFGQAEERMRLAVRVDRLTMARVIIPAQMGASAGAMPALRIQVLCGWPPQEAVLAVSGEDQYREAHRGLETPDFNLEPQRPGVQQQEACIVMERAGRLGRTAPIPVEILSDGVVSTGSWVAC